MTVRQVGRQTFKVPKIIAEHETRLVLNMNEAYKNVRELTTGTVFELTVKPNLLLLGTNMQIELGEDQSGL